MTYPAVARFPLGGHRGLGCTDHEFYAYRDLAATPVENTLASIEAAYAAGADYIETDATMTADGVLLTLHNVVPQDHFFGDQPADLLNRLSWRQIQPLRTGRMQNGTLALLDDVLALAGAQETRDTPFTLNIEIKGVQGSSQAFETNEYLPRLAAAVARSPIAPERVLFSSFCLENIIAMANLLPRARYGMLFGEKPLPRAIYADHQDDPLYQYLPFTASNIALVADLWRSRTSAALGYLHPEITTIDKTTLDASKGFGVNCWALFERMDAPRAALYRATAAQATMRGIPFTAITDTLAAVFA